MPAIGELIRGAGRERRSTAAGRNRTAAYLEIRHPVWLGIKYLMYAAVLAIGLIMVVGAGAEAASYYGQADALAHAPTCARSVDLPSSSEDCVGNRLMSYSGGVYEEDDDLYSIDLDLPRADVPDAVVTVEFPSSTRFEDAAGDGGTLRATFWQGTIVAMTVGPDEGGAVTVISTDNPNITGGTDIGVALMGTVPAALALLLTAASRPVRRRLPRGLPVPFLVSGLIVLAVGCFFTAMGVLLQPELVARAGIVGGSVSTVIVVLTWLIISRQPQRRRTD